MYFYLIQTDLNSIKNDLVESINDGVQWGNTVVIALTASLLAISIIKFLFDRSS